MTKKAREAKKGNKNPMYGRYHTEKSREKMSGKPNVIFGTGKIGVSVGAIKGNPINELILFQNEKAILPIGTKIEGILGKRTNELPIISRWLFKNSESVQVVIDFLQIIKKALDDQFPKPYDICTDDMYLYITDGYRRKKVNK